MKRISIAALALLLAGCGHNRIFESESFGLAVEVPTGAGSVVLSIGSHKSTRALLRGGSSLETTTSSGAGLFGGAAGHSKVTQYKANAQLNEGNILEIMTSSNCPPEAKIILAKNFSGATEAPFFPVSVLQTKEATIHLGKAAVLSNGVEKLDGKTGIDLMVDKVTDVIGTNVVNHTLNTAGGVVHDAVNPLEGTVAQVHETVQAVGDTVAQVDNTVNTVNETVGDVKNALLSLIGAVTVAVCILILVVWFTRKPGRKKIIIPEALDIGTGEVDPTTRSAETTDQPPADPVIEPLPEKPKEPWYMKVKRFGDFCVKVIQTVFKWFLAIPKPLRDKAAEKVKEISSRHKKDDPKKK